MYDPASTPSAPPPAASRPRTPVASRALAAALPSTGATDPARLGVLAAILYNPIVLVGYLLYLYGPSAHCVAGPLCQFGTYPGAIQIVLMLLGIWLLWLLLVVVVRRILEAPGWQGRLTRWLRALSDYESVKELLGLYAVVLIAAMLISFMAHVLTPTTLILGGFTAAVSIRAALLRDLPRGILGDHAAAPSASTDPARALPPPSAPFATSPFASSPFVIPGGQQYNQPYSPVYSQPYDPSGGQSHDSTYDQPTAYSPPVFSRPTDIPTSRPVAGEGDTSGAAPELEHEPRYQPGYRPEQGQEL